MLDELKDKAADLLNNENVKQAVEKAKEFANSEKGKETIENLKEKAEDFIEEKTDGKGIFGFGKKE
ncbi:MAG: hypothetical protein K2J49_09575 [Muribaculaceae bacterium]|nr:hypothetical protein [Muribaculaceae bacterium]MDE6532083.1 hypothetical protein [Muribaculaceae bacterium]MDE6772839.1 hypothetical protein [Muribaculaceae bacterium]